MNNNGNDSTPIGVTDASLHPRARSFQGNTTITSDTISPLPAEVDQMTVSQDGPEVQGEAHLWNGQDNRPLDLVIEKPDNVVFGNHRHHDAIGMDIDIETSVEDSDDSSGMLG